MPDNCQAIKQKRISLIRNFNASQKIHNNDRFENYIPTLSIFNSNQSTGGGKGCRNGQETLKIQTTTDKDPT